MRSRSPPAHPRSRGENIQTCVQVAADLGSSPLTRGKHDEVDGLGDHGGSSPLTRGKPRRLRRRHLVVRLIPAHAGKTNAVLRPDTKTRAHPRSRGENLALYVTGSAFPGSSPLTRGKLLQRERQQGRHGLIPAHAGKTLPGCGIRRGGGAHPRSRGENWAGVAAAYTGRGSSPLTRGKPPQKTRTRGSPLTRGKRFRRGALRLLPGLIPAHAGKTSPSTRAGSASRAHPRSRGENINGLVAVMIAGGSSPLTRGKPSPSRAARSP